MELAPEKLIEMLEKGESLPNVILMYGEENYYRSKAAACIILSIHYYIFADINTYTLYISYHGTIQTNIAQVERRVADGREAVRHRRGAPRGVCGSN